MTTLMQENHWVDILALFTARDELFAPFRHFVDRQGKQASDAADPDDMGTAPPDPTLEDLVQARTRMRDCLDQLRNALSRDLGERDVYYVLFPIVAHLDEEVQTRYVDPIQMGAGMAAALASFMEEHADYADPIQHSGWPSFQRELFDTDAAGELFYQTLDELLPKAQTLPLIFEVYYFCLNDGFRGRLVNNPAKRQEYMDRLKQRIPHVPETGAYSCEQGELRLPPLLETLPPAVFYSGAVLVVAVFYLTLKWMGAS